MIRHLEDFEPDYIIVAFRIELEEAILRRPASVCAAAAFGADVIGLLSSHEAQAVPIL